MTSTLKPKARGICPVCESPKRRILMQTTFPLSPEPTWACRACRGEARRKRAYQAEMDHWC